MTPLPRRTPLLAAAVLALPAGAAAQERVPTLAELPARAVAMAISTVAERAKASADSTRAELVRMGMIGRDAPAGEASHVLFVIDGVLVLDPEALQDVNPQHIEKVEIVKGFRARELYSERAADGAILITTRRLAAAPPR